MAYPRHGSLAYRLLAALIWRPFYWTLYRQGPELRVFGIRRRIWGGKRITPVRQEQLRALFAKLQEDARRG